MTDQVFTRVTGIFGVLQKRMLFRNFPVPRMDFPIQKCRPNQGNIVNPETFLSLFKNGTRDGIFFDNS